MTSDSPLSTRDFAERVAIVAGILFLAALLFLFLWQVAHGVLVLFAAVVLAVVLDGMTRRVSRYTRLPHRLALTLCLAVLVGPLGAVTWTGGVAVARQAPELRENVLQALTRIETRLRQLGVSPQAIGGTPGNGSLTGNALALVRSETSNLLNSAIDVFVILVAAIYFASSPWRYTEAIVKLVPKSRRQRALQVLSSLARALRRWMIGRFLAMLAVGLITGVGMWLLNVRLAVLLGFIAGALTFVPYLGTITSLIPAVLSALLTSPATALYVFLVFVLAHFLEGYVMTPLIQEEAVRLPAGWLIIAQVFGGLLAGIFGVLIATPVAIVAAIMVQTLYVEDVLGDEVQILGE